MRRILRIHYLRCKVYGMPGNVMQIVPKSDADRERIENILKKVILKGEHFNMLHSRHADYLMNTGKTYVRERFGPIYLIAKNDRAFKVDDDLMAKAGYAR